MKDMREKSRKYFDKIATQYGEGYISEPVRCYSLMAERISDTVASVIDIGCGTGEMLRMLQKKLNRCEVWGGMDLAENMIEIARNEISKKPIDYKVGDVEHIPFDDNSFQLALCMHSFHHYPNPQDSLREMYRVLENDGTLIIVENYLKVPKRWLKNLYLALRRYPNGDLKCYSCKELKKRMEKEGFNGVRYYLLTEKSFVCVGTK